MQISSGIQSKYCVQCYWTPLQNRKYHWKSVIWTFEINSSSCVPFLETNFDTNCGKCHQELYYIYCVIFQCIMLHKTQSRRLSVRSYIMLHARHYLTFTLEKIRLVSTRQWYSDYAPMETWCFTSWTKTCCHWNRVMVF